MSQEPKELSKEEILQRKQELTDFYTENIPHLKVQLEYEMLLRDISKTRAEKLQADSFIAQVMNAVDEEDEDDEPPMRILKKS